MPTPRGTVWTKTAPGITMRYLSDPRRCKPENQKTVLRLPVKPK